MTALEQLRTVLKAMWPGRWFVREIDGRMAIMADDLGDEYDLIDDAYAADAAGIVALHNAAPALIALAEACAAEEQAVCEYRGSVPSHDEQGDPDWCLGGTHTDTCPVALAREARIEALDAIRRMA